MTRILLKGTEAALPTTAGAGTSFSEATVVRLVNTATGADHLVTIQETAGGTAVGTFTIMRSSTETVEKVATHTMFAADAAVLGTKVGFTN